MPRSIISILSSAAIVFSTATYAYAASAPQAPTAKAPKAKKVCKSEPMVGTRFVKKTCHTQAEWDAIAQNDRSVAEGYQRNPCRAGAGSIGGDIQC